MPIQNINLGQYANDGTGDDLRTAFQKVNANFQLLEDNVNISNGLNLGTGTAIFKQRNLANLEFKTIKSSDNSITITPSPTEVDIKAKTILATDPQPVLGADLNLSTFKIYGGDIQTSVYGISVPFINQLLTLAFSSNSLTINMGSFTQPTGQSPNQPRGLDLDFGEFVGPYNYSQNNLDFGPIVV